MTADLHDLDAHRRLWRVARERCCNCAWSSICVVHAEADPDRLECGACHGMTSAVTHWLDNSDPDAATLWLPRLELVRA